MDEVRLTDGLVDEAAPLSVDWILLWRDLPALLEALRTLPAIDEEWRRLLAAADDMADSMVDWAFEWRLLTLDDRLD